MIFKVCQENISNHDFKRLCTDMAVGKMTTSLEMHKWAIEKKINSSFIATGQVKFQKKQWK
jgi:uncharacterized NAD-dependent epimerase/dehydratase family protein